MSDPRAEAVEATIRERAPHPDSLLDLAESVGQALLARGWSLAVAESCTGGWITKAITEVPGASRYLAGGIVAYADGPKAALLGVPSPVIERHGAVSEEVARQMARGVADRFGAEAAVAVTGIAGPTGGTDAKPVGTVWFGVAVPWGVHSERVRFAGHREEIRESAVRHALVLLLRAVANGHGDVDDTAAGSITPRGRERGTE